MSYENSSPTFAYETADTSFKMEQLEQLKIRTRENANFIENFRFEQEAFSIKSSQLQDITDKLNKMQPPQYGLMNMNGSAQNLQFESSCYLTDMKRNYEYLLKEKINVLRNLQHVIIDKLKSDSVSIRSLIKAVLENELLTWKRKQQLAGNGYEFDMKYLDVLQKCCEGLAEIIWINLTQLKETTRISRELTVITTDAPVTSQNLSTLNKEFNEHLSAIILNTFILEKQPPQVMKTNTRFSAKVRFLVGNKLNIHMNPPQVRVSIISENQVKHLLAENSLRGEPSGDILNNSGTMEYDPTTEQLAISFRNMQLKKIRRAEKKATESVVDEKFSLFFQSKLMIVGNLEFEVWTMSLPVTVIVHGNQEAHAWATITWDNAFSPVGRNPTFVVPDRVPWGKLAIALDLKFNAVTGRGLTAETMKYLAEKLFRSQCYNEEFETKAVTWSMFCKESLPDRNFTFWDWFYAIMKLTKEHLKPMWTDGLILGFLRKQDAESMVANYPIGTFLLRFSDSELGGITIAWVGGTNEEKTVTMLQPFTAKDFAIRSLADRLNDLSHLLYLYPDTPKYTAFSQYYTPFGNVQKMSSNGYLKPLLVTHVPGLAQTPSTSTTAIGNSHDGLGYLAPSPSVLSTTPAQDIKPLIEDFVGTGSDTMDMDFYDLVMDSTGNNCF